MQVGDHTADANSNTPTWNKASDSDGGLPANAAGRKAFIAAEVASATAANKETTGTVRTREQHTQ